AGGRRDQDEDVELGAGRIGGDDAHRGGDGKAVHWERYRAAVVGPRLDGSAEEVGGVADLVAVARIENRADVDRYRAGEVPVVDDDVRALGLVGVGTDEDLDARGPGRAVIGVVGEGRLREARDRADERVARDR